jgi:hypothetical protein
LRLAEHCDLPNIVIPSAARNLLLLEVEKQQIPRAEKQSLGMTTGLRKQLAQAGAES